MARPASKHPTELELEILKVLWRDGASTVRHVRKELKGFRKLAHTSVITIMNIMVNKGYLKRTREGKSYFFETTVREEETKGGILGDIVRRTFDGSASALVLNLIRTGDIDRPELSRLRKIIDDETEGEGK